VLLCTLVNYLVSCIAYDEKKDTSKAFDKTDHNLLFAKLVKRNVLVCIVRLLMSLYRQQTMEIKQRT